MSKLFNITNLYALIGIMCVSISVNTFAIPTELGEGGVTGVTMLLYYTTHIPPSITNFLINGTLVLIGLKLLNKEIIIRTIITVALISVALALTKNWVIGLENSILGAIFAGLFMGLGNGFIYKGESTMAGSPLVAKITEKYFGIKKSTMILFLDIIVITPGIFVIGVENSLLTIVSVYIGAKVIDIVVEGAQPTKSLLIVSSEYETIAKALSNEITNDIMYLDGQGSQTKSNYKMLYVIIPGEDMVDVIDIVEQIDRDAFMTITNTSEVFGNNFNSLMDYKALKKKKKRKQINIS